MILNAEEMDMTRQEALEIIWGRLLIVFVSVLAFTIVIVRFGNNFRTSILIFVSGNIGGYAAVHRNLRELTDIELS